MKWKPHPILGELIPSPAEIAKMDPATYMRVHEAYHSAIRNAEEDPLKYGWHLEPWKDAVELLEQHDELMVLGGNRSSKTTFGAKTVVEAALENREAIMLCFSQDATSSVRVQQRAVYEWLPREFKRSIRSDTGYIKYGLKNGFTGDSLIIPDTKSMIAFHTYSQFISNPGKFEGLELGSLDCGYLNLGAWLDEYLMGPQLVETLGYRLATRNAKMLLTFTSIDGETEFVAQFTKGAITVKDRQVDMFPDIQTVPYIQKAKKRDAGLIYFHSDKNPFGGWERVAKEVAHKSRAVKLVRFYGVPDKRKDGQFPMFKRSVNVMRHQDMAETVKVDSKCTRYMIADPGDAKKWFVVWIAVGQDGTWYVYRDWPDKSYGDWAQWGQNKQGAQRSRLSDASRTEGMGIRGYKELFDVLEGGERIFERLIDPRAGARTKQIEEGTIDTIQQMDDVGLCFVPAPGGEESFGLNKLRGLMEYNDDEPISPDNRPKFYISDDCEQTIDSILNFTASEGSTEAWKDPIDCLKYAAAAEINYVDPYAIQVTRKGTGGY